jgi:hypothetical protein
MSSEPALPPGSAIAPSVPRRGITIGGEIGPYVPPSSNSRPSIKSALKSPSSAPVVNTGPVLPPGKSVATAETSGLGSIRRTLGSKIGTTPALPPSSGEGEEIRKSSYKPRSYINTENVSPWLAGQSCGIISYKTLKSASYSEQKMGGLFD